MSLDVRELIRRLRAGESDRAVARDLAMARKTVQRYRARAERQGWMEGELPPVEELNRVLVELAPTIPFPEATFKAAPWKEQIERLRKEGVEVKAMVDRLRPFGFRGSYSSLYRFVVHLENRSPEGYCRVETLPGEVAQVDFGYAGVLQDPLTGLMRKAWFFVMTLSYSRHQFVRFVFDQSTATWLRCHRLAFEALGGVPTRVVIDDLRAAISKAALHDPEVSRSYREFAEHYGFLISPCRPRVARHKGKVESGVRYVKRNFLAGRTFADIHQANADVERWVEEVAGVRIHGTTHERPLARFLEVERTTLLPLPTAPYDMGVWKRARLHPDCHVVVDRAYYSAPHRLIGERLWTRATAGEVVIYHDYERLATHRRMAPGHRSTDPAHYPPHKVAILLATPAYCREKAGTIGPAVGELIGRLLDERPLDRLRSVQAILRLAEKHGERRLDRACRRALCFEDLRYSTVKRILVNGLESEPLAEFLPRPAPPPRVYAFARLGSEIFFPQGGTDHGPEAPVDPEAQGSATLGHSGDTGRA